MPEAVHALFQQRIAGDDALLRLAGLRFAQMGVAAEVYADTPDQLEYVLRFVPAVVFLEYAAGLDLGWFTQLSEQLQDAERVSFCIDVGHVGIKQAGARFWLRHPGLGLGHLTTGDDRLPDLVADVQDAVGGALPDVLDVVRSIGRIGKPLHLHLHDGHPLVPGLHDHFSFLMRLPIPFAYQGRQSLSTMYGPAGLAAIVSAASEASPTRAVSFTLEVHQVEGRLPLADAAWLFRHWRDTANAERMNYWLSVLSDNAMLMSQELQ